jgi:hypothetical protein
MEWKEVLSPNLPEDSKETTKKSQDSPYTGRDLNLGRSEYEARILPSRSECSVIGSTCDELSACQYTAQPPACNTFKGS